MNIIVVDDEKLILNGIKSIIEETLPGNSLSCFNTSRAALDYAQNNRIDMAFLDIEIGGLNGLQLAKRLKDIYMKTIVIFITGHPQHALDAFNVHASGYILKPVTKKAMLETVECLPQSIVNSVISRMESSGHSDGVGAQGAKDQGAEARVPSKKLHVQTFGNFEVFVDGKPLAFSRTKTKEMLAYLVSRQGAKCNNNEITAVLWEDRDDAPALQNSFRQLVMDLTQTLNEAGAHDVLLKERGHLAIAKDKISCDFYDFCAGINISDYMGEFMNQYGWAEFTNSYLNSRYQRAAEKVAATNHR